MARTAYGIHGEALEQSQLLLDGLWPLVQRRADLLEVLPDLGHLPAGRAAAAQDGGRVERGDDDAGADGEPLPPDPADRDRSPQYELGGEPAQRHDDGRIDELDALSQPGRAGIDLVRKGVAVPRRAAHDDVVDVDVLTPQPHLAQQRVQQLSGRADERLSLLVLVVARALPDEHQVRV